MDKPIVIGACVYLMHNATTGLYKIGYTTQMPEKRKAQIQYPKGNPFECHIKLDVHSLILCESEEIAKYVEARLHGNQNHLQEYPEFGREWFRDLTTLSVEAFSGDIKGVWGWRQVAKLLEREVDDAMEGEMITRSISRSDIQELEHDASFATWLVENMVESMKDGDLDSFWFYAQKRDIIPALNSTN